MSMMSKVAICIAGIIVGVTLTVLCTGCGHNVITAGKGAYLGVVLPYAGDIGVKLAFGDMLNAVVRENSEVNFADTTQTSTSAGGTTSAVLESGTKVGIKIGEQVSGYTVDLEEVKQGK